MKESELKEFIEWIKEIVKTQHSDPSPVTLEKFKNIDNALYEIKIGMQELKDSIDKRYASKWVEWVAKGMVGAILLYFAGGLLGLFKIQTVTQAFENLIKLIC